MKQNNKRQYNTLKLKQMMKQLTNKRPLCYTLPNAHLVAALPFIDQELGNQVHKSKVAYLIRAQQETMQKDVQSYVQSLPLPQLSLADSEGFEEEVRRVTAKLEEKDKSQYKSKKKENFVDPPKKIAASETATVATLVKNNVITYQNCISKSINLDLYKKFGPLVLKELIDILDKERATLSSKIQAQRKAVQSLNQNRKYLQTESFQREQDIEQRIKIMLNKRRKVE